MQSDFNALEFLRKLPKFDSRNESYFWRHCIKQNIRIEYHPSAISPYGDERRWSPDFYLPEFETFVELKPIECFRETERIIPIVIESIQSGMEYWTWFVSFLKRVPKIIQWTSPTNSTSESRHKQMQRFVFCDPPADIPLLGGGDKEDAQMWLFDYAQRPKWQRPRFH